MELLEPTREAFRLLLSGDAQLWYIILTSIWCSLAALLLISPPAIALGFVIAKVTFTARRTLVVLIQALLSFPTVVVGLVLYMLLSRQGPLGFLRLLFTPEAMILGYMLISFPVLVVFTLACCIGFLRGRAGGIRLRLCHECGRRSVVRPTAARVSS